jgi:hypothetical protein
MITLTPSIIEATIISQNDPITHPITTNADPIPNTSHFFAVTDSAMAATVLQTVDNPENKFLKLILLSNSYMFAGKRSNTKKKCHILKIYLYKP